MKLNYQNLLYLILFIIALVVIYKLYSNFNNVHEGFQSVINKFKNTKKKISKFTNIKKGKRNGKLSFDDIIKEAEEMEPERYTVSSLKKNFFDYLESFKKEDFKNVTGTTNEALDKFSIFKDKFFEIFN
jgi:hypothetical protein